MLSQSEYDKAAKGQDDLIVNTNTGMVEGGEDITQKGTKYIKFKGIPYAEPPVGDLRLRDPVQKRSWEGTLNGKKEIDRSCLQPDVNGGTFGSEDCLLLSIFTPSLDRGLRPVMLWIPWWWLCCRGCK